MTRTGLLKKVNYTFKVQTDRVEAGPYRVHIVCQEVEGVEKARVFLKINHGDASTDQGA